MGSFAEMEEAFDDNCNINVEVINRLFSGSARKLFEDTLNSFMQQLLFKIEFDKDISLSEKQLAAIQKYKVGVAFNTTRTVPPEERCCMLKKDGGMCTRRKKQGTEFCAIHLKTTYTTQYNSMPSKALVPQITISSGSGATPSSRPSMAGRPTSSVIGASSYRTAAPVRKGFDDVSSTIKRMYNMKPASSAPVGGGSGHESDLDSGSEFSDSLLPAQTASQCATLEDFGPRGEMLVYDNKIYRVTNKKALEQAEDFDQDLLDTMSVVGIKNGTDITWAI